VRGCARRVGSAGKAAWWRRVRHWRNIRRVILLLSIVWCPVVLRLLSIVRCTVVLWLLSIVRCTVVLRLLSTVRRTVVLRVRDRLSAVGSVSGNGPATSRSSQTRMARMSLLRTVVPVCSGQKTGVKGDSVIQEASPFATSQCERQKTNEQNEAEDTSKRKNRP